MNLIFSGFGRWTQNIFLSFIEDTIFPFPFCKKVEDRNSVNVKKMSWRRRVDVNMAFYVILLMTLSALNIYYKSVISKYLRILNDLSYFDNFVYELCFLKRCGKP